MIIPKTMKCIKIKEYGPAKNLVYVNEKLLLFLIKRFKCSKASGVNRPYFTRD